MSAEDPLAAWKAEHPDWAKDLMPMLESDAELRIPDLFPPDPQPPGPRLWDARPDTVVHIAAPALHVFGIYLRQRCAWCGVVLLEYDLRRMAFQVDPTLPGVPPPLPATWAVMGLVRVDGHMSAEIENPPEVDGDIQLPTDCCCFDPETQIP